MNNTALQVAFEQAEVEAVARTHRHDDSAQLEEWRKEILGDIDETKQYLASIYERGERVLKHAVVDNTTGRIDRKRSFIPTGFGKVFNNIADEWDAHYASLRGLRRQLRAV